MNNPKPNNSLVPPKKTSVLVSSISLLVLIAAILGLVFGLNPSLFGKKSGDDGNKNANGVSGTYYYVEYDSEGNEEYDPSMFFKFHSDKWTDDEELNGTFVVDADLSTKYQANIKLYLNIEDVNVDYLVGYTSNRGEWIDFSIAGETYRYKRNPELDGKPLEKTLKFQRSEDLSYYTVKGIGDLNGDIVIPETHKKRPVTSIAANAFQNCTELTSISIPESITEIGQNAFASCKNLVKANISAKVSILPEKIFSECGSLSEITIPQSVKAIGNRAFFRCYGLNSVEFGGTLREWSSIHFGNWETPDDAQLDELGWANPISKNDDHNNIEYSTRTLYINGEAVTDANITYPVSVGAFLSYYGLQTLNIGTGIKVIEKYTFYGCENLQSVIIADNSVEKIGMSAFQFARKLESINIPTCVVELGGEAFGNSGLKSAVIGNGVQTIEALAFGSCSELNSVTIGTNVEKIETLAFSNTKLTNVTIPNNVMYIESDAFANAPLSSAIFERNDEWIAYGDDFELSSTDIGDPTIAAKYLTKPRMQGGKMDVDMYISPVHFELSPDGNSYTIKSLNHKIFNQISLPFTWHSKTVTSIADNVFASYNSLISISIPDTITNIGRNAFRACTHLMNISIPTSVTNIGEYAFYGCSKLVIYCSVESKPSGWNNTWASSCPVVWNYPPNETADDGYIYTVINGLRLKLKDDEATVIWHPFDTPNLSIPEKVKYKGMDYAVTGISDDAFSKCIDIKRVTVPKSITHIGENAFTDCKNIEFANIPSWAINNIPKTNLKEIIIDGGESIPNSAFKECSKLEKVTIIDDVTSIGNEAFSGCNALSNVMINYGVTNIGFGAFSDCSSLTSITIPNSISSIGKNAFKGCDNLKYNDYEIGCYLGNENNHFVALIKLKDNSITSCTIQENTKVITDYIFDDCILLEKITVDENNTNYASQEGILYNKMKTEIIYVPRSVKGTITIPGSVTYIKNFSFSGCQGLTSIIISDGVTSIGDSSFSGCFGLSSITIPSSVTNIGSDAFYVSEKNLVEIIYLGNLKGWCKINGLGDLMINAKSDRKLFIGGKEITGDLSIPNNLTTISSYAFYGCTGLTSITIPDGVTTIEEAAFSGCTGLTSITIPNSVTSIGAYSFEFCDKLVETENGVHYIDKWVIGCDKDITTITLRNDTVGIANSAFFYCRKLTNVTIPDGVTNIGATAFRECTELTSITIPNSVTSINGSAFWSCYKLKTIMFNGTKDQWKAISGTDQLKMDIFNCIIHCTDGKLDMNGNNISE